jgi:hypothetical protein
MDQTKEQAKERGRQPGERERGQDPQRREQDPQRTAREEEDRYDADFDPESMR